MGIVSTTILSLLVICSFLWRVQAFPEGCKKFTGTIEGAIPEEYVVKMTKGTLSEHIVKLMLEMTKSGCEGKVYRTSSASNAVMGPIACSNMVYMERFGFAAKMNDAAVMWLCDKDAVDYIEPSYVITLPTTPPATVTPSTSVTEPDDGSGTTPEDVITPVTTVSTSQPVGTTDSTTEPDGSGTTTTPIITTDPPTTATTTAPVTTAPVTTAPVTTDVTPPVKCGKMRGGSLLKINDYLIMFQYNISDPQLSKIYTLLELVQTVDSTFSLAKMNVIFKGPIRGFYYDGLGESAVIKLCENDLIDYIEVKAPPCHKIQTYSDDTGIIEGKYTVKMEKDMTKTDLAVFIELIQKQSADPNSLMNVQNLHPAMELKMFIADLDEIALQWICKNPQVDYIDPMKKTIQLPDNSLQCTNIKGTVKDSNKCKIYVKDGCQHFVDRLSAMNTATNRLHFSVKRISHKTPPMIIAYMKSDAVHEVCKSSCVKEIVCK